MCFVTTVPFLPRVCSNLIGYFLRLFPRIAEERTEDPLKRGIIWRDFQYQVKIFIY